MRVVIDQPNAAALTSALVSSWLDYANSVLCGSLTKNTAGLQQAPERGCSYCNIQKPLRLSLVDAFRELHWLPIQWHIRFRLASLTFKAMLTGTPLYLSHLLITYRSSRVLGRLPSLTCYKFLALISFLVIVGSNNFIMKSLKNFVWEIHFCYGIIIFCLHKFCCP